MVHAVHDQYSEVFGVSLRPAAEHGDELQRYALGSHGVVCLDVRGEPLWRHPGHEMTQQKLDEGVSEVLRKLKIRTSNP